MKRLNNTQLIHTVETLITMPRDEIKPVDVAFFSFPCINETALRHQGSVYERLWRGARFARVPRRDAPVEGSQFVLEGAGAYDKKSGVKFSRGWAVDARPLWTTNGSRCVGPKRVID